MINAQHLHTFGLKQQVARLITLDCISDVEQLGYLSSPFYILGEGSNTIFVDDYIGTVIQNRLRGVELNETQDIYQLSVSSGENWHSLVKWCLAQDIGGFENLALIPGTVGAAPIQNIGAYGVEVASLIERVEYFDLADKQHKSLRASDCAFGYRDSVFKQSLFGRAFITRVHFALPKHYALTCHYGELAKLQSPTMHSVFDEVVRIRQSKLPDPEITGNAGSFFKNPVVSAEDAKAVLSRYPNAPHYPQDNGDVKFAAGWLIEQCGFKGEFYGGVQCHPQQALVLTNANQGVGSDVLAFARKIISTVDKAFGIRLENEVRLLGRDGLVTL